MPRRPRLHVPGGFYHVILRGNHREPLFGTRADRAYLNALVGDVAARFDLVVHAYCWMTNHLHLAIQVGEIPLSKSKPMQLLAMRYSRHAHSVAGQVGHLFERRFRAILVDYLGRPTVPWLQTDFVLGMFGPTVGVARARYRQFMAASAEEDSARFDRAEYRDTRERFPGMVAPRGPKRESSA